MSVLDNFEHWKDFLADRLHQSEHAGMDDRTINEVAYQIGGYLADQVNPQNEEERLLKQLWECGNEEERHAIANLMVKLVDNEGTNQ